MGKQNQFVNKIVSYLKQLTAETDAVKKSEFFRRYLGIVPDFWRYSYRNQLLIMSQMPQQRRLQDSENGGHCRSIEGNHCISGRPDRCPCGSVAIIYIFHDQVYCFCSAYALLYYRLPIAEVAVWC
ncbi:hypothetical protein ACFL6S_13835 [Candidatus Poribacteria bacterium]